jgi:ubiquinol-cytochrome c reductase cytochrome b subunit
LFCIFFWFFITDVLWLAYLGGQPANSINLVYSQFFTVIYFVYFLILLPFSSDIENFMYKEIRKIKKV